MNKPSLASERGNPPVCETGILTQERTKAPLSLENNLRETSPKACRFRDSFLYIIFVVIKSLSKFARIILANFKWV